MRASAIRLLLLSVVIADVICSEDIGRKRIGEGKTVVLKDCATAGYVNLRWDVKRFSSVRGESGEIEMWAEFADHPNLKYFEIDGEDFTALRGNPVTGYNSEAFGRGGSTVQFTVYCRDDNRGGRVCVFFWFAKNFNKF